VTPSGIEPATYRFVAQNLNHCATAVPNSNSSSNDEDDDNNNKVHFNMCKETGVQLDKKHWYERVPKSVETSQGGKVEPTN